MTILNGKTEIQNYISSLWKGSSLSLLSDTNNYVYRVEIGRHICVVKVIVDNDIPTNYLVNYMLQLRKHMRVPEVYDVRYLREELGIDLIVMEYIKGESLANVVHIDDNVLHMNITDSFINCLEIFKHIDPPSKSIGLFKVNSPSFESISMFNEFYLLKYWRKCKQFISETSFINTIENWLSHTSALIEEFDALPSQFSPVDLNLKNFLINGKQIVLLNIPILGNTHPAHGMGAAAAQLRHSKAGILLREYFSHKYPHINQYIINYFEIWMLIGILAFYAGKQPNALKLAKNWGSPVSLMEDIGRLVTSWDTQL